MMKKFTICLLAIFIAVSINSFAKSKEKEKDTTDLMAPKVFNGLKMRLIGPAVISGRVVDFAVNPTNKNEYFVAVASGGVWKTTNAGITFTPVFDSQGSFSIGCVTIDPKNTNVVWVGSGENNSQRSVCYGDGIYKSTDGGKSWKNMGLKKSEHIGKIIIDPRCSQTVYVAAQGPLWGPGGDRGFYKTTDGGENWQKVLDISENTGVSDIVQDPRNPDVLYATSYQRRRHVWTLINGGPECAVYKTTDAGKTWNKLTNGIPGGELGRIGLAMSPVNPDVIFALVEATDGGGLYRTTNRGATWEKRSDYSTVSAQYYQEMVCDPKDVDKLYILDTYLKVSFDGGKTYRNLGNKHRHVDDHAIWIDPNNTDYLLVGGDGGVYESYDGGENWRYFENLPVGQFYRIATDNSEPFYYVYGGTQDNSTWGGPSRTINSGGITNEEWFLVIGGDGYKPQIDPMNPDIVYGQWQYGNLVRFDRKSGEVTYIQPQPEKGEEHRWNWDTPLLISPHSNTRLYIANNRLYRSDDMGNTWKAISPDLTRKIDRNQLKVMGKIWHPEAVAKNASTSFYGNIISISESPKTENLIYIGTDDGLIQVTEDGGQNWRKIEKFTGVPETTYVSDIFASQYNENVVYATFDNHKNADFKPYILKSTDKGNTWISLSSNLPENGSVYTIAEDFVNPNLLFVGTEFGLFFTIDGGNKWVQLKGDFPIIAVRDLEIQKRENDLVVGTFGRSIYILDDYTPLRELKPEILEKEFNIFPIKDALMFLEDGSKEKSGLGETFYRGKNPPFGAIFTYYLKEAYKTKKDLRKEAESKAEKEGKDIIYPTFEQLRAEDEEEAPVLIFTITDAAGKIVRKLTESPKPGINRIAWDLREPDSSPINKNTDINKYSGLPVPPGKYMVSVEKKVDGNTTRIAEPIEFTTKILNNKTLPAKNPVEQQEFYKKLTKLNQAITGTNKALEEVKNRIDLIQKTLLATSGASPDLLKKSKEYEIRANEINIKLNGDESIAKRNANQPPSINDRFNAIAYSVYWATSDITQTAKDSYRIVSEEFKPLLENLRQLSEVDLKSLEKEMEKLDAPWTPGRIPEWNPE